MKLIGNVSIDDITPHLLQKIEMDIIYLESCFEFEYFQKILIVKNEMTREFVLLSSHLIIAYILQ
jgi:hypothetical protein